MAPEAGGGRVPSAHSMRSRSSITGRLDDPHEDPAKLRRLSVLGTTAAYTHAHVA